MIFQRNLKNKVLKQIYLSYNFFNVDKIIKFQRAKIENLQAEIEKLINTIQLKDSQITEIESKGKNISEESKKYVNQITTLNEKLEITKKQLTEQTSKHESQEKELITIRKVIFLLF